jgi:hypothetical protein
MQIETEKRRGSVLQGCQSPYLRRDQSVNTAVGNFIIQTGKGRKEGSYLQPQLQDVDLVD